MFPKGFAGTIKWSELVSFKNGDFSRKDLLGLVKPLPKSLPRFVCACNIPHQDVAKTPSPSGFSSQKTPPVIALCVDGWSSGFVGVSLSYTSGSWSSLPEFLRMEDVQADHWYALDNEAVTVLCTLAKEGLSDQLKPLESLGPKVIERMHEQILRTTGGMWGFGPLTFFRNVMPTIEWLSALWSANHSPGAELESLVLEIETAVGVTLTLKELEEFLPRRALMRRTASTLSRPFLLVQQGIRHRFESVGRQKILTEQASRRHAFSEYYALFNRDKGGDPKDVPTRSRKTLQFPEGKGLSEEDLKKSGIWWWRERTSWPERFSRYFDGVWVRSALFYEFRARLTRPPKWSIFKKPWIQLSNRERGILYLLWPPESPGEFSLANRAPESKEQLLARFLRIDVTMSDNEILQQVNLQRAELAKLKPQVKQRTKGRVAEWTKWGWTMIEAIDRNLILGTPLPDREVHHKQRFMKNYEAACAEIPIPFTD